MQQKSWKKSLLSVSMIGLALSLTATACSSSGSKNGNGGDDKVVTLRMIESLTSPNRTAVIQESIKAFMDQNPNIKVELISPPFDQADNKIRTMLNAKQELDVLEVRDLNVAEFVNNGYVEPLNEYTKSWDDFSTVTSVAQSVASVGDKLYFIPNGLYQRQLFYRADWLKDAGITVPATYEELVEASVKLTDPSKNRFGFSFRGGSGANAVPDTMIQAYSSDKINMDDAMFLKDGGTIYSSPEAKEAVEQYVKLYKVGSPPDSINWGFQEQVQAFTSGVTAFLLQDPDVIQTLTDSMEEGTWATAPMPKGPQGKALISAGGAGWGIPSYSKNKEAAWKLISFLSSPEENTKLSKSHGTVPIHSSATEDAFFQNGPYKTLLDMTNQPDTFINFKPPFQYPANGQWGTVAMESGQRMLLGKASVEDTLKEWDDYWVKAKAQLNN
ncbi:multiple sugar transport system substrate-binding protein [Paenibacillus catalpae]|uniref:Multiple sugar transport system substrate-binding protein n=1 Tax=Paenibacillus catalpae TaxID=1045775 RepID=A0A1I2APC4_9BACL|nr:sugar ABC transporter substrate-binding protein [Paenibacillus catalpae]SFE45752.1 multiple sugar transport system substrate-binding protein [Paenibacillus catalpae]